MQAPPTSGRSPRCWEGKKRWRQILIRVNKAVEVLRPFSWTVGVLFCRTQYQALERTTVSPTLDPIVSFYVLICIGSSQCQVEQRGLLSWDSHSRPHGDEHDCFYALISRRSTLSRNDLLSRLFSLCIGFHEVSSLKAKKSIEGGLFHTSRNNSCHSSQIWQTRH